MLQRISSNLRALILIYIRLKILQNFEYDQGILKEFNIHSKKFDLFVRLGIKMVYKLHSLDLIKYKYVNFL